MPFDLASNALTDLNRVKFQLGMLPSDTDQDHVLIPLINGISQAIETYCRRKFKSQTYQDEVHDDVKTAIFPKSFPITAIASIYDEDTLIDPSLYRNRKTFIDLKIKAQGDISITYTAGFEQIPEDLQHWTAKWVVKEFLDIQEQAVGKIGQRQGNVQYNYSNDDIPPDVKAGISHYRKVVL